MAEPIGRASALTATTSWPFPDRSQKKTRPDRDYGRDALSEELRG